MKRSIEPVEPISRYSSSMAKVIQAGVFGAFAALNTAAVPIAFAQGLGLVWTPCMSCSKLCYQGDFRLSASGISESAAVSEVSRLDGGSALDVGLDGHIRTMRLE